MDKKILLQNLADSLSERTGMTKRKAENFVRSFFEITEEGLLNDGVVKVKGFGTTKVVKVNDRESVNINTGERFQIEGHAKVTFTPDASFKDLVNRPFAQFSTIVLEDDVDIEELNAVDAENGAVDEELTEGPAEEGETIAEENEIFAEENETIAEENETIVEENETIAGENETVAEENETIYVDNSDKAFMVVPHKATEEEAAEEETAEEAAPQEASAEEVSTNEDDSESPDVQALEDMQQPIIIQNTMPAPPPHNWWRIAFFTLLTVLLMVASYFAGYYRIFCPCTDDCTDKQPAAVPAETTRTDEPKDTLCAQKGTAEATAATEAPAQQENTQVQAEQADDASAPKGPTAAEREAAKKYRQMEEGEYLITGVIEIHKMAVGDNLYKLAKKAYGNKDLANYIIFHNRFTNPDVIQLGQDIEIPKFTHK